MSVLRKILAVLLTPIALVVVLTQMLRGHPIRHRDNKVTSVKVRTGETIILVLRKEK